MEPKWKINDIVGSLKNHTMRQWNPGGKAMARWQIVRVHDREEPSDEPHYDVVLEGTFHNLYPTEVKHVREGHLEAME